MSEGAGHESSWQTGGASLPRPPDTKKIVVEFTESFGINFSRLPREIQEKGRRTVELFIDCYLTRQFPKGLRVHKCGPFLSLSISMNFRIFVLPVPRGIKFVFVGDHTDADRYLRKS